MTKDNEIQNESDPCVTSLQHNISAEKAADIEFNYVSGEMRARTEFNRRVQNVQITLLTSIFIAPLVAVFTTKNQLNFDDYFNGSYALLVSFALLGVITVNFIIFLEVEQNHTYIAMVTGYFDIILTRKYLINKNVPAFEYAFWVNFLGRKARSTMDRNVFSLSAHVFLSLAILLYASMAFIEHQLVSNMDLRYRILLILYFILSIFAYAILIYRQGKTANNLRKFVSIEEIDKFAARYPVLRDRINVDN